MNLKNNYFCYRRMKPYGGFELPGPWVLFACGARFFTGHCGHCRGRVPCGKHAVRSAQRHACRPDGPQAHPDCCRACKCRCRCGHGGELRPCGVCAAMALEALSFNLASGTLEALTYDTLAEAGQKSRYIQQTSRQYTLYSITQSAASPDERGHHSAGFVTAYLLSACVGLGCAALGGLFNRAGYQCKGPVCLCGSCRAAWQEMRWKNVRFLLHRRRLAARMLCISLVCAAAYLTQMFWQQGLVDAGLPAALVGVPLFFDAGRCAGCPAGAQAARTPWQPVSGVRAGCLGLHHAGGQRLPAFVWQGQWLPGFWKVHLLCGPTA